MTHWAQCVVLGALMLPVLQRLQHCTRELANRFKTPYFSLQGLDRSQRAAMESCSMNRVLLRIAQFGHQPAWQQLLRRIAPISNRANFPLLGGLLAFLATLSLIIPVVPILTALVVMNRQRWRALAAWAVLGSSLAGALVVNVLDPVYRSL